MMRSLFTLLLIAAGLAFAACGSPVRSAANQTAGTAADRTGTTTAVAVHTPVSPPYAHITPIVRTPRPIYTPVPLPALTIALDACLKSIGGNAARTATEVQGCLAQRNIGVDTLAVEGTMPIVFVEQEQAPCFYDSFIVSLESGTWRARDVSALFPHGDAIRLIAVAPALRARFGTLAMETGSADSFRLIDLAGFAVCGSGPRVLPVIFALRDDAWSLVWQPWGTFPPVAPPTGMMVLSDTGARFTSSSGDVMVTGSAWGIDLPGQPTGAGNVFAESHPGPHRYVDQTWRRDGDSYAFISQKVEPSGYNTLVNFITDISTGDDRAAAALTTDPALVATARALGLVQLPLGKQWVTSSDESGQAPAPIHILSGPDWPSGPPQPTLVTFVQRNGAWLIASLTAEPP
ncbi:MAG TPA: hypothetical protein VIE40_00530, partial [Dehalococcoidia bacterium]